VRRRLENIRHLPWLLAELIRSGPRTARIETELGRLQALEQRTARLEGLIEHELSPMLGALVREDAENRRRLHRMRASPQYEDPFTDPDPLVSVLLPTQSRPHLLKTRSLPSILSQSHSRLEVLVVGDHAGPETAEAVKEIGDQRVVYRNLTQRFLVSEDSERHWLAAGSMARNEAMRTARGQWLISFDDDDEMRPGHVETLLGHAREHQLEVAYGQCCDHRPGVPSEVHGAFPPRPLEFAWQAAIRHAGLRFFEGELVTAALGIPGDWFTLERMLRAGVRFGHVEQVVYDYYPAKVRRHPDGP